MVLCGDGKFFLTGEYRKGCIGISNAPGFPPPDHSRWWPDSPHWLGAPQGPALLEGY